MHEALHFQYGRIKIVEYIGNHVLVGSDAAMVLITENKWCLHAHIKLVVSLKECFAVLVEVQNVIFHAIAVDTEIEVRTLPCK